MTETMISLSLEKKTAILEIALSESLQKREEYKQKIKEIKNEQSLLKVYGAFKKEREQMKHSLFYYEELLNKVNQTIEEIEMWKKEFVTQH